MKRIALFGGSFNPPHKAHRQMAEALAASGDFDEIIVLPCGPRPDKVTTKDIAPVHRAALVDLTFAGVAKTRVVLDDLELDRFTPTHQLQEIYSRDAEVWHVVGSDLLQHGAHGRSPIHREWERGAELWERLNFVVFTRPGYPLEASDYPPHHRLMHQEAAESSTVIRGKAYTHQPIVELVERRAEKYILRHRLYQSGSEPHPIELTLDAPRIGLVVDESNKLARQFAQGLESEIHDDPDLLLVLGGDGFMLETVRAHWRRRIPFYGINFGHRGFLLNSRADEFTKDYFRQQLALYRTPLLYVRVDATGGTKRTGLAFNEALAKNGYKAAWLSIAVDDTERIPKLVGDGALVATAAGSTGYALSMGAPPLMLGTPALLLVGSNVYHPLGWKYAVLREDAVIEIQNLDGAAPPFRPVTAVVDDEPWCSMEKMTVRASKVAAVELAFNATRDMTAKLAEIQFPQR